MTDDEVRALAQLLQPYRRRVEAAWRLGGTAPAVAATSGVNLLSPTQAAARLGCSRPHIYDLVAAGKLRRFGISAKKDAKNPGLRVADSDVDAYIAAAEMPIAPPMRLSRRRPTLDREGPIDASPPTG